MHRVCALFLLTHKANCDSRESASIRSPPDGAGTVFRITRGRRSGSPRHVGDRSQKAVVMVNSHRPRAVQTDPGAPDRVVEDRRALAGEVGNEDRGVGRLCHVEGGVQLLLARIQAGAHPFEGAARVLDGGHGVP